MFLVLFISAASNAEEKKPSKKAAFVRLDACCEESVRPAVERRIQGELVASGLRVVPVSKKKGESLRNALEKALLESGADTAVALHLSEDGEALLSMVIADRQHNGGMKTVALGQLASESEIDIAAIKSYEAVVAELDAGVGTQPGVAMSNVVVSQTAAHVAAQPTEPAATSENRVSKAVASEDIVSDDAKSTRTSKRDESNARRAAEREAKEARRASKHEEEKKARSSPRPPENGNRGAQRGEDAFPLRRFGLEADFRLQWSKGGVGPMGAAGGGILGFVTEHLVIGAMAHGTAVAQDIQTTFASSSVRLMIGRIFAAWMFRPKAILRPLLGVEVGAGYLKTEGKSDLSIDLKTERALLFYAGGIVTLSIRLGSRTSLPVSVLGGVLPPGVTIEFAGEKVVGFNMFLLEATMGVEVLLF